MAICAIGFLGFMVWGHHMFVSGMSPYSGFAFSVLTMSIGVPSAIKTFNWLGTLWGGKIQFKIADAFRARLRFAVRFAAAFPGLFLAQPAVDNMLHATYYVVAHFHLVMGVAAIFGIFAATYFWFPKMFGRMMNEPLGKTAFLVHVRRRLLHLHADALRRHRRRHSPLRGCFAPSRYLAQLQPVHDFMTDRRVHHRGGATYLPVQFFLQPEVRPEGSQESLERHDSGMDHRFAAAHR